MFRYQWVLLFVVSLLLGDVTATHAMEPDDYLGDAAIYTGVPSERPTPNILLLIDTSKSTLTRAPGIGYNSTTIYSNAAGFDTNMIYDGDNAGQFDPLKDIGVTLDDNDTDPYVSCTSTYTLPDPNIEGETITKTVDVHSILALNGTYSGAGSSKFPNIGAWNSDSPGGCVEAAKGDVFATGNYLNYINSTAVIDASSIIIEHTYPDPANKCKNKDCAPLTGNFLLTADLVNAFADAEPMVGPYWELYWSSTSESPTYPKVSADDPTWDGTDGWVEGANYYAPVSATAKTQREAFYEALVPVINGASPSVNFGFMTYNPNIQGAVLGYHITEFGEDPSALIDALPRGNKADGTFAGPDIITAGPQRPQSEALYDAGYYFMVNNGVFTPTYVKTDGSIISNTPKAVNLTPAEQIPSNMVNICGYNHIILLTNGLPNQDSGTPDLGDWDNDGYEAESIEYGAGTHYLDDVAYYLHNVVDINGDGKPGDVTIHTILAFQTEDELIKNTAEDGGGLDYTVADTNGLTKALQEILANIVSESDTAFVAPVVPASSTNRTISSNKVYLGLFKPQTNAPWHGNLKKYTVSSKNELLDVHGNPATDALGDFVYSQSFWGTGDDADGNEKIFGADGLRAVVPDGYVPTDPPVTSKLAPGGDGGIVDAGGVGGTLQARDLTNNPRKIYTYLTPANSFVASANTDLTVSQNRFSTGNSNNISYENTLAVANTTEEYKLVRYMQGYDAYGTTPTAKRNWIFGDILHSKPLVFNYSNYTSSVESTCTDFSDLTVAFNSTVVFVGANDGMLHAFRDCDGEELWAFIPPSLLKDLKNLPAPGHEYYVDAPASAYVHDFNNNGIIEFGDKVVLIFGLRRGGGNAYLTPSDPRGSYVALDVTNPVAPRFLFEIDNATSTDFSEMGETWSQPRLHKIMDGTDEKLVFFVGAGYDNNEDRRWGNTQGFPVSVYNSTTLNASTDTTVLTNDGEPGFSNAGMTSSSSGAQLNPKGRGLYIVELATLTKDGNGDYSPDFTNAGSLVWQYTYADDTANMRFSIPSDLAVLDWDGDGFADRVYAGDTGGQMWRFNLPIDRTTSPLAPNGNTNMWTGDIIFKANPGFTGSVDADGNVTNITDSSNGKKIFYRPAVARYGSNAILYFGTGDREHPLNLASADRMYMLFDRGQGAASDDASTLLFDETTIITETNLVDVTENELQNGTTNQVTGILNKLNADDNFGWYIRLENSGEKMLAPPVVFFGEVFYTTYAPLVGAVSGCEVGNLGISRLYHLDFKTGEAAFDYDKTNNSDDTTANDRAAGKDGEVLKKTDRVRILGEGIPSGIVTLIDASGQVTMMISASNRVGTYQAPDAKLITPVYWMQWND